jgi:hypothetical protein
MVWNLLSLAALGDPLDVSNDVQGTMAIFVTI